VPLLCAFGIGIPVAWLAVLLGIAALVRAAAPGAGRSRDRPGSPRPPRACSAGRCAWSTHSAMLDRRRI